MDEHHLTTGNENTHDSERTNEDQQHQQPISNDNKLNQISSTDSAQDTADISEMAQSQLCCSCRYEKAVFICTVCNENGLSANNFASNDQIADKTGEAVYFSPSKTSMNDDYCEEEAKAPDAEVLMRRGNMVYCDECFKDVHKAMSNNHKPIHVFQVSSLLCPEVLAPLYCIR